MIRKTKAPNFLLIGAPKAGTTSIAAYLNEHPDIFISKEKEPFYLISDTVKNISQNDPMFSIIMKKARLTWDEYLELFNDTNKKLRGEATVHYLYHYDTVIPNIKDKLGDIPIVIVLRNPVTRAFSNFSYLNNVELNDFETSLDLEDERKSRGWNSFWFYKSSGQYCTSVSAFLDNFTKVYIVTYEDFRADNVGFMQNIYSFLGADSNFIPNIQRKHNTTMIPKNKFLHIIYFFKNRYKVVSKILPISVKKYFKKYAFVVNNTKMNNKTKKRLYAFFENDIVCLEKRIGRKMNEWKKDK